MSKFMKNQSSSSKVVVVPSAKQPKLTPDASVEKIQLSSSEQDSLPHPMKNPSVIAATEDAEQITPAGAATRAPRDPHGHKLMKISDIFTAAHKTKYLPLADGQYTSNFYLQPLMMKECGKNWCEMEMLELIDGTTTLTSSRVYSIDSEDLLKMCYLHAMANYDIQGISRLHFEQWVLSVLQEYSATDGAADYTDRGSIARFYLENIRYNFAIGGVEGKQSRVEVFFQKRCIRDLSKEADDHSTENVNVVTGKSLKSKFEYQIEAVVKCVPENKEKMI